MLAGATARADPVEDPDTEIAKRHFATGNAYYTAKRYEEALHEFNAAKKVKPLPALEFNIGRCYDRMEMPKDAVEHYELYLAASPPPKDVEELRARIAVLKKRVDDQMLPVVLPPPPQPKAPAPPPKEGGRGARIFGVALIAVGVLAAGSGAIASAVAASDSSEVSRLFASGGAWDDKQQSIEARGRAATFASIALYAAGGAVAVTGAVIALVARRRSPSVAVAITPGGASLGWSCGF